MADTHGPAAHALIDALAAEPWRYDFFQALRLIECRYAGHPRLGKSIKAADDPVRLAQAPELDFAPSALAHFEPAPGVAMGRLRKLIFQYGVKVLLRGEQRRMGREEGRGAVAGIREGEPGGVQA